MPTPAGLLEPGRAPVLIALGWAALAALATAIWVAAVPALVAPVLLSALPLAAREHRTARQLRLVALVGLVCFVGLAILSVGLLFLPSALAMGVAVWRARHRVPFDASAPAA